METESQVSIAISALALVIAVFAAYSLVTQDAAPEQESLAEADVAEIADGIAQDYSRQGEPLYTGSGMGFTVEFENGEKHYISGDTHVTWQMEEYIGERVEPDVAYMAAGNVYTMDLRTAGWASSLVDPEVAVPVHYDTFDFMDQDEETFINELEEHREAGETDAEAEILGYGDTWERNGVEVTYVAHNTMFLEGPSGFTVVVDPWINTNPLAPEGWQNNPDEWPEADMILFTHAHLDHYSPEEVEQIQERTDAPVIAEWEHAAHMINQGFENVVAVNNGANMSKETIEGAGATGAIENMPDDARLYTHWAAHSSSPASALGAAFGIVDDEDLDY